MKSKWLLLLSLFLAFSCGQEKGQLLQIEGNETAGFHFPYFLFIPEDMETANERILIVEPNNSGFTSDAFEEHLEKAKRTATKDFYLGNFLSRRLDYPLLVPVFPRPADNWHIYTHSLDRDAMNQQNNELERLDLQLLAMIDDAQARLTKMGYPVRQQFLLTGFSASGTFANRFSMIHPERILAVAAGGLNGLLMLPTDSLKGHAMNYPLGICDFADRFGKPFQLEGFRQTPQLWFMGELDDNDAIPYADGYDEDERTLIYQTLGEQMQPERWTNCALQYEIHHIEATIKTHPGIGHEHPELVKQDVLKFFKAAIDQAND
ncbi:hypothetical protein [Sunxiuqinia dokdonensis]|uniref:Phospholipase/carboxylesterase/thioesterase domain-containing protein n=1 Tax=Sunxiuqinia dokdonensis TaxID=1409788 RepID=A0A0L8VD78_9BACT|nr:hypothetical protein [Sunxiuqinia dokdonensis]KOH46401.1 hypothetical protein NC99_07930 [Sunxiuqinia dokdonensis]